MPEASDLLGVGSLVRVRIEALPAYKRSVAFFYQDRIGEIVAVHPSKDWRRVRWEHREGWENGPKVTTVLYEHLERYRGETALEYFQKTLKRVEAMGRSDRTRKK